jgi:RecB family exonuclease
VISVTEVEDLIRDPYKVYARRVLGLRPLDPLAHATRCGAEGLRNPQDSGTVRSGVSERPS